MKWRTFSVQRKPGFRFNLTDLILLAILGALCFGIYSVYPYDYYFLLPGYVGVSFFLFCNVFRIGNKLEPIWYITFLVITLATIHRPEIFWPVLLGVCEPLKIVLIVYRIRGSGYVGLFSRLPARDVAHPD